MQTIVSISILVLAAALEVGGDAVIRHGLRGGGLVLVIGGAMVLATYGVVVNTLGWDFSRLLGVYVAVFATAAVLAGRFVFHESVPASTWIGLAVIVVGGSIIQVGASFAK